MSMHAEDHYLRIVTDKGEALVLMRLRDAIGAMNTDDGMQTHQSHWVSTSSNPVLIRQMENRHFSYLMGAWCQLAANF